MNGAFALAQVFDLFGADVADDHVMRQRKQNGVGQADIAHARDGDFHEPAPDFTFDRRYVAPSAPRSSPPTGMEINGCLTLPPTFAGSADPMARAPPGSNAYSARQQAPS